MKKYKRLRLEKQGLQNKWGREGDLVVITAGNDAGKTGKVLSRTPTRVTVEGVNMRKKMMRKSEQAPNGQIIDIEMSLHASNVRICDKDGNPLKLTVAVSSDGERQLVHETGGVQSVYRTLKKVAK